MDHEIRRFEVAVPEAAVDDLRRRLGAVRWPEPETDPSQGIGLERLRSLCSLWSERFDWRVLEARLNAVDQGRTLIDGLRVHFLHARSSDPEAVPLLLTHGWPGSVVELLDVVPLLTAAGFHCVVPSLPGYGWSDRPRRPGWGVQRIADAWALLMERLGYGRFVAVGTDWGTSVTALLGSRHPERLLGVHVVPPLAPARSPSARPAGEPGPVALDPESGYSTEHRTRPQTIGYALVDSPVALAAWVGEKLTTWTDPRWPLSDLQVLDGLSVYWFTGTGASAARLYWESLADVDRWLHGPLRPDDLVAVPAGCSVFPYELQQPQRVDAEARFTDIRHWGQPTRGGHFAAWEQPELFVEEVRAFRSVL